MNSHTLNAKEDLIRKFFNLYPIEAARFMHSFSTKDILDYLHSETLTNPEEIYSHLNPEIASGIIDQMNTELFIRIFTLIDPAIAARLLSRLEKDLVQKKLGNLPSSLGKEIKELMEFPNNTAGYLMDPVVITFHPDDTVNDVLQRIRATKNRRFLNINIVDENGKLVGVIPLQEIAIAATNEPLKVLIQSKPIAIQAMAPREEIVQLLEERKLFSIPVVDAEGKLLGIIRYDALINAAKKDVSEDLQAMFGAGREEQALSKASFAVRKRLPWLEINLATAFLAAAVVGIFEDTIAKITVLAVFLPVVAGQSGNTGSQALAVTMRGLALREIRTRHWFLVARKEILVGFINGCAVALTTSLIVFFWANSIVLAMVIAVSMVFSMAIAGLSGAVIPIILKALGQDPAQSSSIILTTVTDIVGFMSFLGLATLMAEAMNIV